MKKVWLSVYLFYAPPFEKFLTDCIAPFIEEVTRGQLITQFFFIRYSEKGPHIRLRLKSDVDNIKSKLKPYLTKYFSIYYKQHPSKRQETIEQQIHDKWFANNSIYYIAYKPEIKRYGGPVGIAIAEKQFVISSRIVLSILKEKQEWNTTLALGTALQLHVGLVYALKLQKKEIGELFDLYYRTPGSAFFADKHIRTQYRENFLKQKKMIIPTVTKIWEALYKKQTFDKEWYNEWIKDMSLIGSELSAAEKKHKLKYVTVLYILSSYIHMTNNRLGINYRDESFLAYVLQKSFEEIL